MPWSWRQPSWPQTGIGRFLDCCLLRKATPSSWLGPSVEAEGTRGRTVAFRILEGQARSEAAAPTSRVPKTRAIVALGRRLATGIELERGRSSEGSDHGGLDKPPNPGCSCCCLTTPYPTRLLGRKLQQTNGLVSHKVSCVA